MKTLLALAAALTLGGTAIAQSGNTVADQSQSSGPQGMTQQGTDPEGQACTPAGFNAGSTAYQACGAGGMTSGDAGATRPPCSRTVTDGCVQTYERGMRTRR
ncbi:MAG TPA: hypothetical protein VEZ20_09650 [Allosphingosinicella sp.]|jgi:hypothetical protein|nr:hypothetical protein [Allosphingosinicella sp.]